MQEYYRGKTEERGKNVLEDEEKKSWAESFLEQLNDPLIFILFVAAAISLLLREYGDMAIIPGSGAVKCDGGSHYRRGKQKIAGGAKTDDQPACTASGRG